MNESLEGHRQKRKSKSGLSEMVPSCSQKTFLRITEDKNRVVFINGAKRGPGGSRGPIKYLSHSA